MNVKSTEYLDSKEVICRQVHRPRQVIHLLCNHFSILQYREYSLVRFSFWGAALVAPVITPVGFNARATPCKPPLSPVVLGAAFCRRGHQLQPSFIVASRSLPHSTFDRQRPFTTTHHIAQTRRSSYQLLIVCNFDSVLGLGSTSQASTASCATLRRIPHLSAFTPTVRPVAFSRRCSPIYLFPSDDFAPQPPRWMRRSCASIS